MNQDELFRKLTRGAKFDRVRYREDAENLGIVPKAPVKLMESTKDPKKTIFVTEMDAEKTAKIEFLENFDSLNALLRRNIKDVLKWETPTRIQMASIPVFSTGRNCVATAQTGSGKTGAFLIPVIERLLGQVKIKSK